MDYLRYDCILREILEDRKTLTGFLDAIFGFMSRNTDFYHIQTSKEDKIGFPRGVKENIIMSCMQKYEDAEQSKLPLALQTDSAPSYVAEEVEITTVEGNDQMNKSPPCVYPNIESVQGCCTNTPSFTKSDYKNGSVFERYCWSQTLKDVELTILLPNWIKSAKQIRLSFQPKCLTVKSILPKEEILINGETWDKYCHNNVIWSISDEKLIINFDKRKQYWWDKLFLNESPIDSKNVDTELYIDNDATSIQNDIEKYEQQSFSQNSTEMLTKSEQVARLKQAWNVENSPFKGLPFDPSVIQFN